MGLKFRGFRAKFTLKPKKKEPEIVCLKYHVYDPGEEASCTSAIRKKRTSIVKPIPKTRSFIKTKLENNEKPKNLSEESDRILNSVLEDKTNAGDKVIKNISNTKSDADEHNHYTLKNNQKHEDKNDTNFINDNYAKSTLIFMTENNDEIYATSDIKDNNDVAPPVYKLDTHPYGRNSNYNHKDEGDSDSDDQNKNNNNNNNNNKNLSFVGNSHYSDEAASIFFSGEEATIPNRMRNVNLNQDQDDVSESSQTSA